MENGASDLAYKFAGLGINNNETSSDAALFQVMKAVEAAEATIKQQVPLFPAFFSNCLLFSYLPTCFRILVCCG